MFIDEVTVQLKAGKGGDGCLSFRREAFYPLGGPNGGNGGRGGDVVLVGDENLSDLVDYRFQPLRAAKNGEPGKGRDMTGACGVPLRIPLPLGTAIYRVDGLISPHFSPGPADQDAPGQPQDQELPPPERGIDEVSVALAKRRERLQARAILQAQAAELAHLRHASAETPESDLSPPHDAHPLPVEAAETSETAEDPDDGVSRSETDASDDLTDPDSPRATPPTPRNHPLRIDWRDLEPVAEILYHGQEIILLEGGRGGLGNAAFKSSINQAPTFATAGKPGEEGSFRLVLKTIADVGLVGYPNAGKSSLLAETTNSRAKVGAYPFTTLHPNVGIVEFPDTYDRITVADIPGLIDGASENRGLGHRFLKHVERCRVLLYVLDMAGSEGRDPLDDFNSLRKEIAAFSATMVDKPSVVAANKMDEPGAAEHLARFRAAFPQLSCWPISCLSEEGLPALLNHLRVTVKALPALHAAPPKTR